MTQKFETCIKRMPIPVKATCWICGLESTHQYYDPEAKGFNCRSCLTHSIHAEMALVATEGISRPETSYGKQKKNRP
jgi:hypothetical protein